MLDKFVSSAIRQVGRDLGKVVSNQAFGDAHSTPIRHVNRFSGSATTGTKTDDRRRKTDFEKALNFKLSYTPKTLVGKLLGALIEFKKETDLLLSDDHLSTDETRYFLSMLNEFSTKAADVAEVMEVHPKSSSEDEELMYRITNDLKVHVHRIARAGYEEAIEDVERLGRKIDEIDMVKAANINLIWAGLTVASLIAGYFIWKSWMLFPVAVAMIGFRSTHKKLTKLKARKANLEKTQQQRGRIGSALSDLMNSPAFSVDENS